MPWRWPLLISPSYLMGKLAEIKQISYFILWKINKSFQGNFLKKIRIIIAIDELSISCWFVCFKRALILRVSIFVHINTITFFSTSCEISFIDITVLVNHFPLSVWLICFPFSFKSRSINELNLSTTVLFSHLPLSYVSLRRKKNNYLYFHINNCINKSSYSCFQKNNLSIYISPF